MTFYASLTPLTPLSGNFLRNLGIRKESNKEKNLQDPTSWRLIVMIILFISWYVNRPFMATVIDTYAIKASKRRKNNAPSLVPAMTKEYTRGF